MSLLVSISVCTHVGLSSCTFCKCQHIHQKQQTTTAQPTHSNCIWWLYISAVPCIVQWHSNCNSSDNIPCHYPHLYLSVSCPVHLNPANMRTYMYNIMTITVLYMSYNIAIMFLYVIHVWYIICKWNSYQNIPCHLPFLHCSVSYFVHLHPTNINTYIYHLMSVGVFTCHTCVLICAIDRHLTTYLVLIHIFMCLWYMLFVDSLHM